MIVVKIILIICLAIFIIASIGLTFGIPYILFIDMPDAFRRRK